jgi:uncharacterized protein DUF3568
MHCLVRSRPSASSPTGPGERGRVLAWLVLLTACLALSGCLAVGATIAGLGFSHQINGIQYRTFTEPLPRVSRATVAALKRMAFKLEGVQPTKTGELIKAAAADRKFEVELEALTEQTTRMRAVAKNQMGVIVDASIAQEIIRQAEKALEPEVNKKRTGSARGASPSPQS